MAYTTINKSTDYFTPHIWSGTNSNHTESIGMQPDLVWVKGRSVATDHTLFDAVRGPFGNGNSLSSNTTAAEGGSNTTAYGGISGVTSDGFTVTAGSGNADYVNTSGRTYASWNWKANGTGSANTDGSISSTVSANTTSGFSIVKFTGTGANATVGHGLGVAPKVIIIKNLIDAEPWIVYHTGIDATAPEDYHLRLNTNDSKVDEAPIWNDTAPTSSVFSLGSSGAPNGSGDNTIAYCFADVQGYSKFGSYTGNGNADGAFVYTGFKPAFVIRKKTNANGNWIMQDNKRPSSQPFNEKRGEISGNTTSAETSSQYYIIDFLSNGFKCRTADSEVNGTGGAYIYMAFASAPQVGSNNVPCTAR